MTTARRTDEVPCPQARSGNAATSRADDRSGADSAQRAGRAVSHAITTVTGEVAVEAARGAPQPGIALIHEHLSCDLSRSFGPEYVLSDETVMTRELAAAREGGVRLMVDCGNSGHGRDPLFLRRISAESGVLIVASTGHYREGFFPAYVETDSPAQLAERMLTEIRAGIEGTDVRAGAIAEIGTSGAEATPSERKVFEAAAMAQADSGVPLMTHTAEGLCWRQQLDMLRAARADLNRVVIGHMDCTDDGDAHRAIIEAGAWLGFDRINSLRWQSDDVRINSLLDLIEDGYAGRIVLSHDIASTTRLRSGGGPGYTAIRDVLLPRLRDRGVDEVTIGLLCSANAWSVFGAGQ